MASGVFPALPLTSVPGGLLSAATVSQDGDRVDWANGPFGWDSFACPGDLVVSDLCAGKQAGSISSSSGGSNSGWPFGILTKQECLSVGYTVDERNEMVRRQLEVGTEKALERELQTGAALNAAGRTNVHWLADADAVKVSGASAGTVAQGVAALEQALADCGVGAQGVIHMPRAAASMVGNALVRDGDRLFTNLGTPVVAGSGYAANISPAAATTAKPAVVSPAPLPGSGYIYATGPVAVRLGPIDILDEQVDRAKNVITVTAARPAAVYFDNCCHFSAEVKYA